MLEEKLQNAHRKSEHRIKQIAFGLLVAVGLCCSLLIGISLFDFHSQKEMPPVTKEPIAQDHETLMVQAEDTILKAKQLFSQNLEQASSFLSTDQYDEALFYIEKAMMVNPASQEALAVKNEIEKLPTLLPLLREASIANSENYLKKEYTLLLQISQLTPDRQDVSKRLTEVAGLIVKEQFEEQISSGFAAIDRKIATKARHHYQQAKKIDPSRKELSVLLDNILTLEKSTRIKKAIGLAEQAIRRDDWRQAEDLFTKILKDEPNSTKAIEGKNWAKKILRLQSNIQNYLDAPYRVSDPSIQGNAKVALGDAQTLANFSFTLKRQAEQLQLLIAQLNQQISVTVASDGKTNVIVRGVGKIGTVTQKAIFLKPGNYTFEGSRKGFKSKLLPVLIPYDHETYSINVICDERI